MLLIPFALMIARSWCSASKKRRKHIPYVYIHPKKKGKKGQRTRAFLEGFFAVQNLQIEAVRPQRRNMFVVDDVMGDVDFEVAVVVAVHLADVGHSQAVAPPYKIRNHVRRYRRTDDLFCKTRKRGKSPNTVCNALGPYQR